MRYIRLLTLLSITVSYSISANIVDELVSAAMDRTQKKIHYDGAYVKLDYPMGDVAANTGVCTDVIIRSYRQLGVDFQQLVHEDMRDNFSEYPSKRMWGLTRPDKNIDHRRVPNLQTFFTRHGQTLPISKNSADYKAGDLVTWMINGKLPHIGIVVKQRSSDGQRPLIVHNIGLGPQMQDMLFDFPITGHYRY